MEREYNSKPLTRETNQDLENLPVESTQPYEAPLFERQATMNFPEKIWEIFNKPKFRDSTEPSPEQLTDPDYRLKQLQKLNDELGGNKLNITCSRCHHCR